MVERMMRLLVQVHKDVASALFRKQAHTGANSSTARGNNEADDLAARGGPRSSAAVSPVARRGVL